MRFSGRSEVVPIRTQRVPQGVETPVTFVSAPGAYIRYAYSRSSDSMANQIEGQDYLCFQHNDQRLVFVVSDGVGSSFCGNLAARILGDGLLEWLWSLDITYLGGQAALSEAAASFLNRLQKQARHEVEEYEIPDEITGLVRQALEAQRAYGSEAIFAAARIDHPSPMIPDGLISVLWMGDTRIHVLDEEGNEIEIGAAWDNANRWSTAQGVRGQMGAWMRELKGVGRVVAFTDGLAAHAGRLLSYPDSVLNREISAGARLPSSDDVAFIDVVLRTPRYEGYPDPDLPDPNAERPHLEQIWNPTGADTYELRWNWRGHPKARFIVQEATNPALSESRVFDVPAGATSWRPPEGQKPGHYYYRVRAINRRGVVSPWSELRQTKVSYPPPPAPTLQPVEPSDAPVLTWTHEGEALEYVLEMSETPDFEEREVVYTGRGTDWIVPRGSKPGTYYYRVQAISDGGPSPWSAPLKVEITAPPPPQPHLATVAYAALPGAYELRWQPVPGATFYELEETERRSGTRFVHKLEESSYRVEGKEVGEYVYRVRACHEYACSAWSNEQLAVVAPQAPDQAPVLTVEGPDEEGRVRLEWTEVEGADRYLIEMSEEAGFRNARIQMRDEPGLELVRREPGPYFFRVCAVNAGGDGPWSNVEQISLPLKHPAWIEAELSEDGGRVMLSWGAVSGQVMYRVEMRPEGGKKAPFAIVYEGEETDCRVDVPPDSETLLFRVRAERPNVYSEWLSADPLEVHSGPPAPTLEPPEKGPRGEIRLRWKAVEGASHYILEVARDEAFTAPHSTKTERRSATFHPPTGGRYWFRVRACRGEKTGAPGESVSVQVSHPAAPRLQPVDPVRPHAPFEITWSAVPGCAYYEVQESPDSRFETGATSTERIAYPEQTVSRSGLLAGRYYYRVRAVDEEGHASPWSDILVVEVG